MNPASYPKRHTARLSVTPPQHGTPREARPPPWTEDERIQAGVEPVESQPLRFAPASSAWGISQRSNVSASPAPSEVATPILPQLEEGAVSVFIRISPTDG